MRERWVRKRGRWGGKRERERWGSKRRTRD